MQQVKIQIELGIPYLHCQRQYLRGIYEYAMANCPEWTFISNNFDLLLSFKPTLETADGVLLHSAFPNENVRVLMEAGVPTVNLAILEKERPFPTVAIDDYAVGRAAADHLHSSWIPRMLYVGPTFFRSYRRFEGFSERLAERHAAKPEALFEEYSYTSSNLFPRIKAAIKKLYATGKGRLGIFAFSDSFAYTVNQAVHELDLRVPRDVAILGVDNDEMICAFSRPPLSSIPVNSRLVGYRAAQTLHHLLNGEKVPDLTLIPPQQPVERLSTHHIDVDDPIINAALNLMYDRVQTGVQVAEIVAKLPISRRTFELRFREVVGCTPHEEIQRIRISKAINLLQEGHLSNQEVASACGFSSTTHMAQTIRKIAGKNLDECRNG